MSFTLDKENSGNKVHVSKLIDEEKKIYTDTKLIYIEIYARIWTR